MTKRVIYAVLMLIFFGCNTVAGLQANSESGLEFEKIAILDNRDLKEVSGIQSGSGDVFYVHNDSGGALVHIIDQAGRHQGEIRIRETKNRDWEDITMFPGENGPIVVLGDIGDNGTKHKTIRLYFIAEPARGEDGLYPAEVDR